MQPLPDRPPIAWRGLAAIAAAYAALLIAASAGYGYHRDELYFITIGGHPALGYVDQPPLVPLLAHAMDAVSGGSLVWLRVPAAIAGGLVVLVTGVLARELGGERGTQLLAAGSMAVSAILAAASHLTSTTGFDLLGWTVVAWLIMRALRDGGRSWLAVGVAAGIALEVKTLIAFLLFALLVGVMALGPRDVLRSRWLWIAALVAVAEWSPNLLWEAAHGWPQLELSKAIASGSSGTSQSRWVFLPFQLILISPALVAIWVAGLWRLARDPALRIFRCFALAYPVLVVAFIATGGKPYYLCGMYPVLLAAGAAPTLAWAQRRRGGRRLLSVAVALSFAVSVVLFLPLVPRADLHNTPIVDINYDAGEAVGWPAFVATVTQAYHAVPAGRRARAVVLAGNYGEAGSILHFSPDGPPVYSGHNSMWNLGPPPSDTATVIAVGYAQSDLRSWFTSVHRVAKIDNQVDVDNDEQGNPVWLCTGPREGWRQLWPEMRVLG